MAVPAILLALLLLAYILVMLLKMPVLRT